MKPWRSARSKLETFRKLMVKIRCSLNSQRSSKPIELMTMITLNTTKIERKMNSVSPTS